MLHRFEAFTKAISTSYKCIQKIKKYEMDMYGLKGSHVMCLFVLGQNKDGLSAVELCKACNLDKAAVSRILPALQEEGYIFSNKIDDRKYRIKNCLTEEGKKIADALNLLITNVVDRCGRGLTIPERENFYNSFETITKNLVELTTEMEKTK